MKDCTIDEWVLCTIRNSGDYYHDCVLFLEIILFTECRVCIDDKQKVLDFYNRLVDYRDPSDFIGRWLKAIQLQEKLKIVKPKITRKIKSELFQLKFHDDDLIYVGIAYASIEKKIISGDSDFGCNPRSAKNREDIKDCLEKHGLTALTPLEVIEKAAMIISAS